jgi:hypothetical protein
LYLWASERGHFGNWSELKCPQNSNFLPVK